METHQHYGKKGNNLEAAEMARAEPVPPQGSLSGTLYSSLNRNHYP